MDWIRRIEERLERVETRLERSHQHVIGALGIQRERVERAFDEVKLAMLEQELALKSHLNDMRTEVRELGEILGDVTRMLGQHEERLARLERDRPPAA